MLLDDGGDTHGFEAEMPPVEFLYLDGTRILNYLAQLEGGQAGPVRRITKEIRAGNGKVSVSNFEVGASSQQESSSESTLAPAESSELGLMLRDLRENTAPGVSVHEIDPTQPEELSHVREGWLVRFSTRDLLSPGYIRPYVVVRQSATLAALFPGATGKPVDAARATRQRLKAKNFARQIGPNPRITFAVAPPVSRADARPAKVLLPMQYTNLTDERSMLEKGQGQFTGGNLVVVGKVIRVFPRESDRCRQKRVLCAPESRPAYVDFGTREIWRSPLEHASNYLINEVSHTCAAPGRKAGESRPDRKEERDDDEEIIRGRHCFLTRLRRQTRLYAPGAVIVPLAVYK